MATSYFFLSQNMSTFTQKKKKKKIQKNPLYIVHWISFCQYATKIHRQKKGTSDFFSKNKNHLKEISIV